MSTPTPSTSASTSNTKANNNSSNRKRVHFSCTECHRRKQKCNRQIPCDQCLSRKIPHLCRQFVNGVDDPFKYEHDVKVRLDNLTNSINRLEYIVTNNLINQQPPSTSPQKYYKDSNVSNDNIKPINELLILEDQGRLDKGRFFGSSAMSSVSEPPIKLPPFGIQTSIEEMNYNKQFESNFDKVVRLLSTSGISINSLQNLIKNLPSKQLQNSLINVYFNEIDWRYPLFSPRFYKSYDDLHISLSEGIQTITPPLVRFLPLLLITMAIATLTAPDDIVGDNINRKQMHEKFYGASRRASNLAGAMQDDDLDSVLCGLLTARYLILVRRASEGFVPLGAAIHTAQALGLHRDPSALKISNVVEQELRRRVWAYIYHQDRMSSLLLGRPLAINDADCDTKPPLNIDDDDLNSQRYTANPMEVPTIMSYTILRHSLAQLMGHIQTAAFGLKPPPYHVILQLDQELMAFKESLPPCFQLDHPDLSHDASIKYLSTHRYFLSTEFYFVRITLHRPYLILGKSQSTRYQPSRIAAIESAKSDLVARKLYQSRAITRPAKLSAGSYRIMTSLMILGIALVLTPTGTEANDLRRFIDEHTTGVDEATVRELAVLELFKRGATEVSNNNNKKRKSSNQFINNEIIPKKFLTNSVVSSNSNIDNILNEDLMRGSTSNTSASLNPTFPLGAQNYPTFNQDSSDVINENNDINTVTPKIEKDTEFDNTSLIDQTSSNVPDLLGEHAQALLNQWLDVNSLTSTTPPGVPSTDDSSTNDKEMNFWQQLVSTLSSSS